MRTKLLPLAVEQKIISFLNTATHGCSDRFLLIINLPTIILTLTGGLLSKAEKQLLQTKALHWDQNQRKRYSVSFCREKRHTILCELQVGLAVRASNFCVYVTVVFRVS